MESNNQFQLTPTQRFLATQERIQEYGDSGEPLPFHEAGMHLNNLLEVCEALLHENSHLRAINASAETLIEEQSIEIALKDIEIFNYTPKDQENHEENH